MRLAVGGDHAGFRLKAVLVDRLSGDGHEVQDAGCFDETSVDFPVGHDAGGAMVVTVPRIDDFEVVAIGDVPT